MSLRKAVCKRKVKVLLLTLSEIYFLYRIVASLIINEYRALFLQGQSDRRVRPNRLVLMSGVKNLRSSASASPYVSIERYSLGKLSSFLVHQKSQWRCSAISTHRYCSLHPHVVYNPVVTCTVITETASTCLNCGSYSLDVRDQWTSSRTSKSTVTA